MNTKAQTTIYAISFLACIVIVYTVGHERGYTHGQREGKLFVHDALIKQITEGDDNHAKDIAEAHKKGQQEGACAMFRIHAPVYTIFPAIQAKVQPVIEACKGMPKVAGF